VKGMKTLPCGLGNGQNLRIQDTPGTPLETWVTYKKKEGRGVVGGFQFRSLRMNWERDRRGKDDKSRPWNTQKQGERKDLSKVNL